MEWPTLRQAWQRIGEVFFASAILLFVTAPFANAADLTWMAQEQNCKQFIRKFQAELRGESGIRELPESEQREAREALRKACSGPIGRCEFSFCAEGGETPVLIKPPVSRVDIGNLLEAGEEVAGAKAVDAVGGESRPAPKLPADRMVPVGDAKGAKSGAKQSASARERHPLYDPRQRRLLDELEAEDAAASKRQAEARAAEERIKEELLRELGGQDPSQQVGLNLDNPTPAVAERAPEATPTLLPEQEEEDPILLPVPTESVAEAVLPIVATPTATPEEFAMPPLEEAHTPSSPWSRAGTFPRVPISQQEEGAQQAIAPTAEQLARVADEARRIRLQWLKADLGCKELLGEIKSRYSNVRPASGFSKEVKLDLWEVLNTACSPRYARCKFPQCSKLQRLTAQTDAARAAEDEAKAVAHEELAAAARSDLDGEVNAKVEFTLSLIREAEQRERREKRSWQKVQMQSEIVDRARPVADAKSAAPSSESKAPPPSGAAGSKGQYDPTVYADPRDLDRKPRAAGTVTGKTTSEQRVKASQKRPVDPKRQVPAGGAPPPGRMF